jgi:hypothetical protein
MEENRHSLPFGFLRLSHVITLFVIGYMAWIVFSVWLYYIFIYEPQMASVSASPALLAL